MSRRAVMCWPDSPPAASGAPRASASHACGLSFRGRQAGVRSEERQRSIRGGVARDPQALDSPPVLWLDPLDPLLICQRSFPRVAWAADDHDVAQAVIATVAERNHVVRLFLCILKRAIAIRTA